MKQEEVPSKDGPPKAAVSLDYSQAHVQQVFTCLNHRFPTQNMGVLILLNQW